MPCRLEVSAGTCASRPCRRRSSASCHCNYLLTQIHTTVTNDQKLDLPGAVAWAQLPASFPQGTSSRFDNLEANAPWLTGSIPLALLHLLEAESVEGVLADLAVFDPSRTRDRQTHTQACAFPHPRPTSLVPAPPSTTWILPRFSVSRHV